LDYANTPVDELAIHCLRGADQAAWTEFIRRFHPLIASVVIRVARHWGERSPQAIDDLVQETYLKLCAAGLRGFKFATSNHPDAMYGYIKVFTANLIHDHFKRSRSKKRGGGTVTTSLDDEGPACVPGSSASTASALERQVLIRQIDACLSTGSTGPDSERDRRIFWLYYRVGLAARAIAALPTIGLSTKGVESTLLRLTRQVRQRLSSPRPKQPSEEKSGEGIRPAGSL